MGTAAPFLHSAASSPARDTSRHWRHCNKCCTARQTSLTGRFGAYAPGFAVFQKQERPCSLSHVFAFVCSCSLYFFTISLPFCHLSRPFSLVSFRQTDSFLYVQFAQCTTRVSSICPPLAPVGGSPAGKEGGTITKPGTTGLCRGSRLCLVSLGEVGQRALEKAPRPQVPAAGKAAGFQQLRRLPVAGEQGVGGVAVAGDAHPGVFAGQLL